MLITDFFVIWVCHSNKFSLKAGYPFNTVYTQIFPEKTEFCTAILFTEAIITPVSCCHDQVWSGCFSPFHGDHVKGNIVSCLRYITTIKYEHVFRVETYL